METYYRVVSNWNQAAISRPISLRRRLPEPSHDDLVGPVHLLLDLPPCPHQPVDIGLVFLEVRILADHRLTLAGTARSELAWRERSADLGPERGAALRVDSRGGPALQSLIDGIALRGQARPRCRRRRLARGRCRNVPSAKATQDRSVLDLLGTVGTCTHDR